MALLLGGEAGLAVLRCCSILRCPLGLIFQHLTTLAPAPLSSAPHQQGTYDECCSNDVFARLLREHNADHGAEGGEGEATAELPPGEPLGPAPSGPALMRADTTAISQRAAAEVLTASGRTAGDSGVQQARLAAAPTFAQRNPASISGKADAAADGEARQGGKNEEEGSPEGGAKAAQGGKYGRQLARFETMIQQNRGGDKRPARNASKVGLWGGRCGGGS